jgi:hypothetical protein
MHGSNYVLFDHPSPPTSSAGDEVRRRRRSFSTRLLVEHGQHGKGHGLNTGFNGRLRHRRE